VVSCEGEIRQCGRTADEDAYYEALKSAWLATCGPHITFTPTTPALPTFTPYPGIAYCQNAFSACGNWALSTKSCETRYSALEAQYTACACQPSILTLASLCDIGGALCIGTPVSSTTLWSYRVCGAVPKTTVSQRGGGRD
jgi:hypothetical protein